ncbi:hypothetical protein J6590_054278 [Homalodisca vitripennis]|nr:hypothetical protein J6590_054278 [Homalodisca vitripennis]
MENISIQTICISRIIFRNIPAFVYSSHTFHLPQKPSKNKRVSIMQGNCSFNDAHSSTDQSTAGSDKRSIPTLLYVIVPPELDQSAAGCDKRSIPTLLSVTS